METHSTPGTCPAHKNLNQRLCFTWQRVGVDSQRHSSSFPSPTRKIRHPPWMERDLWQAAKRESQLQETLQTFSALWSSPWPAQPLLPTVLQLNSSSPVGWSCCSPLTTPQVLLTPHASSSPTTSSSPPYCAQSPLPGSKLGSISGHNHPHLDLDSLFMK